MRFEWDATKDAANLVKHGIAFASTREFAWHRAVLFDRSRRDDGEKRFAAVGSLRGKLYTVIFTRRRKSIRIISLRRANKTEEKAYEENS